MHRTLIALAAGIAVSGCATLSNDGGLGAVREIAQARVDQPIAVARSDAEREGAVRERLATPLDAGGAVAIALVNNPALQAAYADLGIAEAQLVQAGRLRNPGISFASFRRGEEREIERRVVFDVVGLVTLPWRLELERAAFASAQMRTAREIVRVADEARRAWIDAVAAAEKARYAEQVKDAAQASAELAGAMLRAGNFSRLTQSREEL